MLEPASTFGSVDVPPAERGGGMSTCRNSRRAFSWSALEKAARQAHPRRTMSARGSSPALTGMAPEAAGDLSSDETLSAWRPRIRSFILARGVTITEADDLTQEIMLRLWRHASSFDASRGTETAWVFRITRNALIDHTRRSKYYVLTDQDPTWIADTKPAPERVARDTEDAHVLHANVAALPSAQRAALGGVYFEGLTLAQVAERERVPLGTIKTRVRLALEKLRLRTTREEPCK